MSHPNSYPIRSNDNGGISRKKTWAELRDAFFKEFRKQYAGQTIDYEAFKRMIPTSIMPHESFYDVLRKMEKNGEIEVIVGINGFPIQMRVL